MGFESAEKTDGKTSYIEEQVQGIDSNNKVWLQKHCGLPMKVLFAKLNRKLVGYYNYYGVIGNLKSLNSFVYQVKNLLYKWLNRRSQRKSYNLEGFTELSKYFGIAKPSIRHAI